MPAEEHSHGGRSRHLVWLAILVAWCTLVATYTSPPRSLSSARSRRVRVRVKSSTASGGTALHAATTNPRTAVFLTNDPRDVVQHNSLNLTYAHMAMVEVCDGWEDDGFTRVVVAWQGSSGVEGARDQRLYFAVSSDNLGRVWNNAAPVPIPVLAGQWAPVLHWDAEKRRLWLFFSETSPSCMRRPTQATNSTPALPERWVIGGAIKVTSYTLKHGWEEPRVVYSQDAAFGVPKLIANRVVVTSKGNWVIPFWQQKSWTKCSVRHAPAAASGVLISTDRGRSWKAYGELTMQQHGTWAIEGTVAEWSPDRLVMLLRTSSNYIYQSTSEDGGRKWTDLAVTVLPNPDTKVSLLSLPPPSGASSQVPAELLVAYNDHSKAESSDSPPLRRRLRLAMSRDGGVTWRRVGSVDDRLADAAMMDSARMLDDGDESAEVWKHYPTLAIARGGATILCAYSRAWHGDSLTTAWHDVKAGIWLEELSVRHLRAEYDARG